jgi:Phosphodiester glycosidase
VGKLRTGLFLLVVATAAHAEWVGKSSRNEDFSDTLIRYRHVDVQDSDTGNSVTVDLAIWTAKSCKVRLIDNPDGANNLADAMRSMNCRAGANGGYFSPNFAPIGLRIVDGKITSRLRRGPLMSGVLASDGTVQILRLGEFSPSKKWNAALECGPFLVDLGRSVRGLEDSRAARRTFAAVGNSDWAALGSCSEVTLADLAKILTIESTADFKIYRALNLDGGSSSAFWLKHEKGSVFYIPEQKSVRDFIAVVPR